MRLATKWPMLLATGLLVAAFGGLLVAAPEPTQKALVRRNAPVPVPKVEPKWKREFDKIYTLEEGELVKIIPRSKQPDCRKDFIRELIVTWPWIKPADIEDKVAEYQAMSSFVFEVDAKGKRRSANPVGSFFLQEPGQPRKYLGVSLLGFTYLFGGFQGFEVTTEPGANPQFNLNDHMLLDNPDILIRSEAPRDKLIPALDKAFDEELKAKFRMDWKEVEKEVWVASGKVDIKPSAWRKANQVDVYSDEANVNKKTFDHANNLTPGHETGNSKQFLKFLQDSLQTHLIWTDDTPPEKPTFDWTCHWLKNPTFEARTADRDPEKVLKHLSEQTGLTFKKEKRKVPMLVISPR